MAKSAAREIFERLCQGLTDDMSKEIVDACANNEKDVISACERAFEGARTMSLFGGRKVIWLRGANFFGDMRSAKTEAAAAAISNFLDFLEKLPADVANVVISASPVDRRASAFKRLQKFAECADYKGDDAAALCIGLINDEAKKLGVGFERGADEALAAVVGFSPRMASEEVRKLASYIGFSGKISERNVAEMVPIFGEGDFFEISNAFFAGDLNNVLSCLRKYFFTNKNASARPIITVLQKQNSLLIQLRALMDGGKIAKSDRGVQKSAMEDAAADYAELFKDMSAKSSYNVFSQNAWYAGSKLAPLAARIPLKRLLLWQLNFAKSFEELINRGGDDEAVMRDTAVRCLAQPI